MKILIIEDEKDMRKLYARFIGMRYNVDFANDGKQALVKLNKFNYDLMLVDLNLPSIDGTPFSGLDIIRYCQKSERLKDIPAVLVSGFQELVNSSQHSVNYFLSQGFDNYMKKPISKDQLLREIEKYEKEK